MKTIAILTLLLPIIPPLAPAAMPGESAGLSEPLKFHDEFVEVTEAGNLRRRYRVRGDFEAELMSWKAKALRDSADRTTPPRVFRLGCVFLKDAAMTCPDVVGTDGQPLRAGFSTPARFEAAMRERASRAFSDYVVAFTGGEVRCEWIFETLEGLKWTCPGQSPAWGCQPKAIAEQVEKALSGHRNSKVDMWVWCAGKPVVGNGSPKQKLQGPPYGISYTQWQLFGGYHIAVTAPDLPLLVHEVNHRYLDNLEAIEGVQLTQFHGLGLMGYEAGDLGYPDLLAAYRSVHLHVIRPAMWRRFSLTGPATQKPEPFSGKMYRWSDVRDDCWFRLPRLDEANLAQLTGLAGIRVIADRRARWRQWSVPEESRSLLLSPCSTTGGDKDSALNNVLSFATESCAVLRTATGHWLIVRPEVADIFAEMPALRGGGVPLEVAGWLNDGVNPLIVFRANADLAVPGREIDYFR